MKRIALLIASAALTLCACERMEETVNNETNETDVPVPAVYHLSIPVSIGPETKGVSFDPDGDKISTFFEEGDEVYVYNKTQDALARHWDNDENTYLATPIVLTSTMIQNEGRSCTLEGDLSFVKWKYDEQDWENVTPADGDEYCLYYQLNGADYYFSFGYSNYYPRFYYSGQDGSKNCASQYDFAEVTDIKLVVLSETTLTVPDNVRFTNLQSMFRQKLIFKNSASETVTPTIKSFSIDTEKGTLIDYYNPTIDISSTSPERYETYSIEIDDPVISSDGNIYLALAFYYPDDDSKNDKLILTATDTEGNVYCCTKNVPAGGFQNGKYYYGNCTMEWDHQIGKPTVTRSDGGNPNELNPLLYDWGLQYGFTGNPMRITISGDSQDYRFYFNDNPGFVTLTGSGDPVSASWAGHNAFIGSDSDLTVILDCNYFIDNSADFHAAIDCGGELKLMTTGGTQTLTVITNDDGTNAYGIYGNSNYDAWIYDFSNISNLAVDGFTVSCPGAVDNPDGTYTWVYTVSPTT